MISRLGFGRKRFGLVPEVDPRLKGRAVAWVRALLRGQKVFARADENGQLRAENGRVEIRYKPNDGRRYEASAGNLTVVPGEAVLPDDACGPAESVAKSAAAAVAAAAGQGGAPGAPAVKRPSGASKTAAGASKTSAGTAAGASAAAKDAALPAGTVVAYADGACSGNPGPAGLGVVVIDGPRRVEISEYLGTGTNNIAELTAVLRALGEVTDPACPLIIKTDSQYTIGVLQKGWKAKANVDLIEELKDALRARPARIQYVPGHSGVLLNERADELAREAVKLRKSFRKEYPPPQKNGAAS
jgi:ribonuclease HI